MRSKRLVNKAECKALNVTTKVALAILLLMLLYGHRDHQDY